MKLSLSLDQFNWDNVASWPKWFHRLLLGCAIVLGMGISYQLLLHPAWGALDKAQGEQKHLRELYRFKNAQASTLVQYQKQLQEVEKLLAQLLEKLPLSTEVPGLVEDIARVGNSAGLLMERLVLGNELQKGFYVELPIQMRVKGTYHQLGQFFSDLAALPRIITLHDFTLKPATDGSSSLILELGAKTYRYQGVML